MKMLSKWAMAWKLLKLASQHLANTVKVILCIKQLTIDDYFITLEVIFCGTQPTFVFVMQQYCSCFSLNMKYIWKIADYCMCLSNCKSSVTNVPTIYYFKYIFNNLMKYVDAYGYKV